MIVRAGPGMSAIGTSRHAVLRRLSVAFGGKRTFARRIVLSAANAVRTAETDRDQVTRSEREARDSLASAGEQRERCLAGLSAAAARSADLLSEIETLRSLGYQVERYTPRSPDTMMYEATMTDPKTFSRPWKISMPLYRHLEKNAQVMEYKCVEFVEELMYGHLRKQPSNP